MAVSVTSRFAVGTHVMTVLAYSAPELVTSEYVATSVNTNPVVIRRLLSQLAGSNLVRSQLGPGGGWELRRDPAEITLLEVFDATVDGDFVPGPPSEPNPECPVGRSIHCVLSDHVDEAIERFRSGLAEATVADLLHAVKARV